MWETTKLESALPPQDGDIDYYEEYVNFYDLMTEDGGTDDEEDDVAENRGAIQLNY